MIKSVVINKAILIILALSVGAPIYAQQETEVANTITEPQNALSFVPQYAILNGLRVDYERRIKNGNHWIVMAPTFFLDASNNNYYYDDDYSSYETMVGVGINLYYKSIVYKSNRINVKSGLPRHSLYFSAGPNYQYFSLTNTEEIAVPFVDNGITYYEFDLQDIKKTINRFGAIANVGWQLAFGRFMLDLYLGVAVKYSTGEGGGIIKTNYAEWTDLDYSGILLDGGVRVGMFF